MQAINIGDVHVITLVSAKPVYNGRVKRVKLFSEIEPVRLQVCCKSVFQSIPAFSHVRLVSEACQSLQVPVGCPLNATGWLLPAATLLEITTSLISDIGHGFSFILTL